MEGARLRVAVLFGGRSPEHEVSLVSARTVLESLDPGRFDVVPVGITREGGFLGPEASRALLAGEEPGAKGGPPALPEGTDCVFPVLHGPCGEDGTVQGWLQLLDVPFVGSDCAGSALAMDKALARQVLRNHGIPMLSWSDVAAEDFARDPDEVVDSVVAARGLPCFVKPARLGSSVGIRRAGSREEVRDGLAEAFRHGRWALVEPAVEARELEVAVLDGDPPVVSRPGEVRPQDWYDWRAKYEDESAELLAPAPDLHPNMVAGLQELALRAFRALRLSGMARVDFFLGRKDGRPALNEVNTIPGFTAISMYPRLLALEGIPLSDLCTRLIRHAMEAGPTRWSTGGR